MKRFVGVRDVNLGKERKMETIIVGGEEFELVNAGTEHEFVKGCFGDRYFEACQREGGMIAIHPVEVKGEKE